VRSMEPRPICRCARATSRERVHSRTLFSVLLRGVFLSHDQARAISSPAPIFRTRETSSRVSSAASRRARVTISNETLSRKWFRSVLSANGTQSDFVLLPGHLSKLRRSLDLHRARAECWDLKQRADFSSDSYLKRGCEAREAAAESVVPEWFTAVLSFYPVESGSHVCVYVLSVYIYIYIYIYIYLQKTQNGAPVFSLVFSYRLILIFFGDFWESFCGTSKLRLFIFFDFAPAIK